MFTRKLMSRQEKHDRDSSRQSDRQTDPAGEILPISGRRDVQGSSPLTCALIGTRRDHTCCCGLLWDVSYRLVFPVKSSISGDPDGPGRYVTVIDISDGFVRLQVLIMKNSNVKQVLSVWDEVFKIRRFNSTLETTNSFLLLCRVVEGEYDGDECGWM